MAIRGILICFLAVSCIIVEAYNATITNSTAKNTSDSVAPPLNQFDFVSNIFNQTNPDGNTTAGPNTGGGGSVSYTSTSSSTSSEEESDLDVDIEVDINNADSALSFARNWMRVRGNMRPMFPGNTQQRAMFRDQDGDLVGDLHGDFLADHDQVIGRTSGTSGQGVAIALGVLGLIALVIAAAFLIIRKQRNNMETFVPISSLRTPKEGDILLNNIS